MSESAIRNLPSGFDSDLQEHHHQNICALNLVRDSVVVLNPQGQITYLNQAAYELYGWTLAEVAGRIARTTLFANNKRAFDEAWRAVWATGEWHGETTYPSSNHNERVIESRWTIMRNKQSLRITSILIVGSEISNLNTAVAGFAHEIRNPLAGIKGVADAFLQRPLSPQEREWMEAVRHEVTKIDARMREVLDCSRSRVFSLKPCSLSELISGVVRLATHHAKSINDRQGRAISVQFIDATTEPLVMPMDPLRIEDAVFNLVLNGIESIERDGLVTVCLRARRRRVLIEVTDNGSGIPQEIRRRIFQSQFTTKREGNGLGLAAVRRTAAAHHGRISFKTRIGRGSKFLLALPLRSQKDLTEGRA